MTQEEEFTTVDAAEVKRMTTTARSKEIDMVWADRISTLGIGQGFKTMRKDTETVRQFKKRINAAAGHSYRSLDWTTLDPKQAEGVEPSRFLAKVKAIDTTAMENAAKSTESTLEGPPANETSENGQGATTEEPASSRRSRAS